jgi:hypothetical protein
MLAGKAASHFTGEERVRLLILKKYQKLSSQWPPLETVKLT